VQLARRKPRCRLEVTRLMSRRQIQQLREAGARRHGNDTAPRMSARHARSVDYVSGMRRSRARTAKVGIGLE